MTQEILGQRIGNTPVNPIRRRIVQQIRYRIGGCAIDSARGYPAGGGQEIPSILFNASLA
jgi:hypothetical protein